MAITYKSGNRIISDFNSRKALVDSNPNLIHHYKFDSDVIDSVNGVNGTVTGTTAFGTVAGDIKSFDFNGAVHLPFIKKFLLSNI